MVRWVRKILEIVGFSKQGGNYERAPSHENVPWSLVQELPLDILVLVIGDLPLVSQACLALTCKSLYRLLHSVLDDKQLAWPRYLANPLPSHHRTFGSEPELPRTDLLLKMEDSHWLYCAGCLKLHPNDHFLSKPMSSTSRHCKWFSGVVDLCACLALTYLDAVKLADWIQTGDPSEYLHQSIRQQFQLRVVDNRRCLVHDCSVTGHPDAFIALKTMVTVDAENCLIVTTRYNLHWSTPHELNDSKCGIDLRRGYKMPRDTETVFLCPHIHAFAWIYGCFASCYTHAKDECRSCDTEFCLLGHTDDKLYAVIQGVRNLGTAMRNGESRSCKLKASRRWWDTARTPGNPREHVWYKEPLV